MEKYARPSRTSWARPSDTHAGLGIHQRSEKKSNTSAPHVFTGGGVKCSTEVDLIGKIKATKFGSTLSLTSAVTLVPAVTRPAKARDLQVTLVMFCLRWMRRTSPKSYCHYTADKMTESNRRAWGHTLMKICVWSSTHPKPGHGSYNPSAAETETGGSLGSVLLASLESW